MRARTPTRHRDWTDANESDLGLTLLELLAWLADELGLYQEAVADEAHPRRRRRYALLVGAALVALFVWWRRDETMDENAAPK